MPPCTVELSLYFLAWDKVYAYLRYRDLPIFNKTGRHEPLGVFSLPDVRVSLSTKTLSWPGKSLMQSGLLPANPQLALQKMLLYLIMQSQSRACLSLALLRSTLLAETSFFGDRSFLISRFEGFFSHTRDVRHIGCST